uniref:Uncharacterized protein n=1 Tax=Oryza sativa subsp. japonica TaxID=39947 RepID=Q8LNR1_ORYSJ|nr:hypothetical protein [Oryza sativa Japonica Group]
MTGCRKKVSNPGWSLETPEMHCHHNCTTQAGSFPTSSQPAAQRAARELAGVPPLPASDEGDGGGTRVHRPLLRGRRRRRESSTTSSAARKRWRGDDDRSMVPLLSRLAAVGKEAGDAAPRRRIENAEAVSRRRIRRRCRGGWGRSDAATDRGGQGGVSTTIPATVPWRLGTRRLCPRSCLHGAGAEDGDELGGTEAWDGDELGEPEREMTTSSAASLAPRIWQAASPLLALSSLAIAVTRPALCHYFLFFGFSPSSSALGSVAGELQAHSDVGMVAGVVTGGEDPDKGNPVETFLEDDGGFRLGRAGGMAGRR